MVDFNKLRDGKATVNQGSDSSLEKEDVTVDEPVFMYRRREIDDWEEMENVMRGGLRYTDLSADQQVVYNEVDSWFDGARQGRGQQVKTLGGYAGTGKSTLVSVLGRDFQSVGAKIAFCAYTGKASNVLRQKLRDAGIHTGGLTENVHHFGGTIHSLVYAPIVDKKSGSVVGWEKKADLGDYDLICVDEASMVDEEMLGDLESYEIPILAVGDHGQLPPVSGFGNLMQNPELRLEKIHRQAEGNPIIALSQWVRENGALPEKVPDSPHIRFCTFNELPGILEPLYETEKLEDIAILTYTNRARQSMNYQGRCMRNRRDMAKVEPQKGDQFINLRNIKGRLFNGMRGILETDPKPYREDWFLGRFYFPDDNIAVDGYAFQPQIGRQSTFKDFDEVREATGRQFYKWHKMGMLLDYGYAMTVHKSQGSSFKHVFLLYERPMGETVENFTRWLYTAVTRSSDTLTIVVG